MDLYATGETGNTVFKAMAEKRKKHRGGEVFDATHNVKRSYNRSRKFTV